MGDKGRINRAVTVRCWRCGLEVTGVEAANGLIHASNRVRPALNAPMKSGLCIRDAEIERQR